MSDDAHAADDLGCTQGSLKGESQKGPSMAVPLMPCVDCELAEKQNRQGVGLISLQ
jgi:hypothetical protein